MALAQLDLVCGPRWLRVGARDRGCVGYSRAMEGKRCNWWSLGLQWEETSKARSRCGRVASLVRSLGHVEGAAVGAFVTCRKIPGDIDGFVGVSTVKTTDVTCAPESVDMGV